MFFAALKSLIFDSRPNKPAPWAKSTPEFDVRTKVTIEGLCKEEIQLLPTPLGR